MADSTDVSSARARFRALHESGCFVIPNPWDVGSARYLASLGFKALATTSSGFAHSRGLADAPGAVGLDTALRHVEEISAATDLPVNADFMNGYADEPEGVAENVRRCVGTGVSGLSIEDSTDDAAKPLYELPLAVDRIAAAREAIDRTGSGVLLTARAECFLVGHPSPLEEAVRRVKAYADAGADVLYAPGPRKPEDIRAIVEAAGGKPVNVLMAWAQGTSVADLAALGARRISVGGSLARTAWTAFSKAAKAIAQRGSFEGFEGLMPGAELNLLFAKR
jgi:2-methylisocitrate lyase-like PEP mutase family enzyme